MDRLVTRINRAACMAAAVVCIAAAASSVHATTFTFTDASGVDHNWSTAANWDSVSGKPSNPDYSNKVFLGDGTGPITANLETNWTMKDLAVTSGTTCTLTGSKLSLSYVNMSLGSNQKLFVNNTLSIKGALFVYGTGTIPVLGGNGTIFVGNNGVVAIQSEANSGPRGALIVGDPNINGGIGTLAIKAGTGANATGLMLDKGTTTTFTFGNGDNSQLVIEKNLLLHDIYGVGKIKFNIVNLGNTPAGIYTLATCGGLSGSLSSINLLLPTGWEGSLQTATSGSNTLIQLNLTTADVPEPASLALLGLGGLLMFHRRKRA